MTEVPSERCLVVSTCYHVICACSLSDRKVWSTKLHKGGKIFNNSLEDPRKNYVSISIRTVEVRVLSLFLEQGFHPPFHSFPQAMAKWVCDSPRPPQTPKWWNNFNSRPQLLNPSTLHCFLMESKNKDTTYPPINLIKYLVYNYLLILWAYG